MYLLTINTESNTQEMDKQQKKNLKTKPKDIQGTLMVTKNATTLH